MTPAPDPRLPALAAVLLRVGVNLQPGQPLLITDPYDLQGIPPELAPLIAALRTAAPAHELTVLEADLARLRALAKADDLPAYENMIRRHTQRLSKHLARGGAFLFLTGGAPQLLTGLPADRLERFGAAKWRYLGPLIQRLIRGATQWTLAPAPTHAWATLNGADLPTLWHTVFQALRIDPSTPVDDQVRSIWPAHLADLASRRDSLNHVRHRRIRFTGPGTDLTLALPRFHTWCTAQLTTRTGIPFVANLPTEEVFTAPHRGSAEGTVRVAHPVTHGGDIIDGMELEFISGHVIRAHARTGGKLLNRLLASDAGACRLGEVALVPAAATLPWAGRAHHHALLDENAAPHIALGDAYRFCSRAWLPLTLNRSQLHLDLPLDATAELL